MAYNDIDLIATLGSVEMAMVKMKELVKKKRCEEYLAAMTGLEIAIEFLEMMMEKD